ncbi:MAG: hypothetical protein JSS07_12430 [Proteobacteria bacterium]|nr:hypothetical protein [Pseudomonadota bacterium]
MLVERLIKYLGHLPIEEKPIYAGIIPYRKKIKDLKQLIKKIQQNKTYKQAANQDIEFQITTSFEMQDSLKRVFPQFKPLIVIGPFFESLANEVVDHFKFLTRTGDYANMGEISRLAPKLTSLTQKEAWQLLSLVHEEMPISSALDLPTAQVIIGIVGGKSFFLEYGQKTKFCNHNLSFDLDDGFYGPDAIKKELNLTFEQWKKNDYQGPLFPSSGCPIPAPEENINHQKKRHLDSFLKTVIRFIKAPSRHPLTVSAFMGLASFSGVILLFPLSHAIMAGLSIAFSGYAVVKTRNKYYEKTEEHLDFNSGENSTKDDTFEKGYKAASSWLAYFNDYRFKTNWIFAPYYHAGMKLKLDRNAEKELILDEQRQNHSKKNQKNN